MKRKNRHTFKMPGMDEQLQRIASATGLTFDEIVEQFMVGLLARKAAYGDLYANPEPVAYEFCKGDDGEYVTGEELYREIYHQAQNFWLELAATFQAQRAYISILEGRASFEGLPAAQQELLMEKYPERFKPEYVQ